MPAVGDPYTSGNWIVSEGKTEEFVAAWTEFVNWSMSKFPGFGAAFLMQQDTDPNHFVSVGTWTDKDIVAEWRGHPEFPEKIGAARSLCDDFVGLDYTVVVAAS